MSTIENSLLGFIIGDAMGVPLEFKKREKLMENPVIVMKGFGIHNVPPGSWSDDTSMTISTIDSIIEKNDIDYKDIMDKWLKWTLKKEYTPCNIVFDISEVATKSLSNYKSKKIEPLKCGIDSNDSSALMRMLPIALYAYYKKLKINDIIEVSNKVSTLTNDNEESRLGCYIYIRYILFLLSGKSKKEAYLSLKKISYAKYNKEEIIKYKRILKDDISKVKINDIISDNNIVNTLEASLWTILKTKSFTNAIVGAINLGDDSDTIGAVTGSIAGIIYKIEDIPDEWLNKLKRKEYLKELISKYEEYLMG